MGNERPEGQQGPPDAAWGTLTLVGRKWLSSTTSVNYAG